MKDQFLYQKLYEALRSDIENQTLSPGDRLPAEEGLARDFQVSAITVKKALGLLAEQGYIVRVPGRGSFVADEAAGIETKTKENGIPPLLGAVLEHVSTPFGLDLLYTLEKQARAAGYRLCIGFSYGDRAKETKEIQEFLAMGVKGLLIMPSHGSYYSTAILKLVVEQFPLVLIDKQLKGIPAISVCTDNAAAVSALVRHLYDTGRRHIGLIGTADFSTSSVSERREGFFTQMKACGLEACAECHIPLDMKTSTEKLSEKITQELETFLKQNLGKMDGVVCTEYGYLAHLCRAAKKLGVLIPDELAACGIDEDYLAPEGYFFTHVKQDERALADTALRQLLQLIHGNRNEAKRFLIPGIFMKGDSTGCVSQPADGVKR